MWYASWIDERRESLLERGVPEAFIDQLIVRAPPGPLIRRSWYIVLPPVVIWLVFLAGNLSSLMHWMELTLYRKVPTGDLFGEGDIILMLGMGIFIIPITFAVAVLSFLKVFLQNRTVLPSPAYHPAAHALVWSNPPRWIIERQRTWYQGLATLPDEPSFVRVLAQRNLRHDAIAFAVLLVTMVMATLGTWYVAGNDYWYVTGDRIVVRDLRGSHVYALKDAVRVEPICKIITSGSGDRGALFNYNLVLSDRIVDLWQPSDPHHPFDRNVTYAALNGIDRRLEGLGVRMSRAEDTLPDEACLALSAIPSDSEASRKISHRLMFGI